MKITKNQLKAIIRENMAMRMNIDRMMKSDNEDSYYDDFEEPRRRKPYDPITKEDIVKGSFKGTTSDRAELTKKLELKIKKLIDRGYEKNVPSNWKDILMVNDGDALYALSKVIFPGFLGTLKRTLFPENKITEKQLRKIIRGSINEITAGNKFTIGSAVDTFDKVESLEPGNKIDINGRPSIVVNVNKFVATLTYVDEGKSILRDLDYRLAVRYDDDPVDMIPEIEIKYIGEGQLPNKLRRPNRKKGPGRSYSYMD